MEIVISVLIFVQLATSNAQQCGTIGSMSSTPYVPLTTSAFYLNIDERTPCSGYVSGLNISFYNIRSEQDMTTLIAYIAFYRPQTLDKDVFQKVTDKLEIQITDFPSVVVNNGNLNSVVFPLSPEVFLEEDTLLGVCIPVNTRPEGTTQTEPLHMVSSSVTNVRNDRLLIGSCDQDQLPDQVGLLDIESRRNLLLHIHGYLLTSTDTSEFRVTTDTNTADTTDATDAGNTTTDAVDTTRDHGVIIGVVTTIAGVTILLLVGLSLMLAYNKFVKTGKSCGVSKMEKMMGERVDRGKTQNTKIVLSDADEELHYSISLPSRDQALQGPPQNGNIATSTWSQQIMYDDENYALPGASPKLHADSYLSSSHDSIDVQVNRSYRSNSHLSIDPQVNRSHQSNDQDDVHSIEVHDNASYGSLNLQNSIEDSQAYDDVIA